MRGRSGRQGDPGFSRFYVSFDDTLLVRFASDNIRKYIEKTVGDEALEMKMISDVITSAQKRIEGQNFDTRKSLLDYDDVLAKQRQIIYSKRDKILLGQDITEIVEEIFVTTGDFLANKAVPIGSSARLIDAELLIKEVEPRFLPIGSIKKSLYEEAPSDEAGSDLGIVLLDRYKELKSAWPQEVADRIERSFILRTIDQNWTKHIDTMARLREGIFLRSYANVNPLQDYVNEGYALFREMLNLSSVDAVLNLLNVKVEIKPAETPTDDKIIEGEVKNKEEEK